MAYKKKRSEFIGSDRELLERIIRDFSIINNHYIYLTTELGHIKKRLTELEKK